MCLYSCTGFNNKEKENIMGLTTYVQGFKMPDKEWRDMKAIFDLCTEKGVSVPEEVLNYFNGGYPDPAGIQIDMKESVREWGNSYSDGFEIDVNKIPKGVNVIRFVNSY